MKENHIYRPERLGRQHFYKCVSSVSASVIVLSTALTERGISFRTSIAAEPHTAVLWQPLRHMWVLFPTAALTGLTGRRRVRADVEPAAGHGSCSTWFRWIRGFLYTAINWQNDTDSASLLCNRWVVLTNFVPLNIRMWSLQKPLIISPQL